MISTKYIHINMDKNKRPKMYTLPDALQAVQRPSAGTICPAWPAWYRVQTGVTCSVSGCVCRALCVVCLASGPVCPAACRVPSFRVRWSGQGCTGRAYRERRGWGR